MGWRHQVHHHLPGRRPFALITTIEELVNQLGGIHTQACSDSNHRRQCRDSVAPFDVRDERRVKASGFSQLLLRHVAFVAQLPDSLPKRSRDRQVLGASVAGHRVI